MAKKRAPTKENRSDDTFCYQVKRQGRILAQTFCASCRYPPEIEKKIIESGCDICVNGRKLRYTPKLKKRPE